MKLKIKKCSHCYNDCDYQLVKVTGWFTLFFIPIFPFKVNYFLMCSICNYGNKITKKVALELLDSNKEKGSI